MAFLVVCECSSIGFIYLQTNVAAEDNLIKINGRLENVCYLKKFY